MPIIAAAAINGELDRAGIQLDDAGAAHTRYTAVRSHAWRDLRFQPTYGVGVLGRRIGKRPGAAALITLAACRTLRGIAGARGRAGIVPTRPVVADLRLGRPAHSQQGKPAKQPKCLNFHDFARTASRPRQHATAREKTTSVAGEPAADCAGRRGPALRFAAQPIQGPHDTEGSSRCNQASCIEGSRAQVSYAQIS